MNRKKIVALILLFIAVWLFNLLIIFVFNGFQLSSKEILINSVSLLITFIPIIPLTRFLSSRLLNKITIEIQNNERLVKEAGANHFKGKEGVGGKLVLTDKSLIFKSHKYNIQNHQEEFRLEDIVDIKVAKSMWLLENVLLIELINHDKHKFIVDEAEDWRNAILGQRGNSKHK